MTKTAKPATRTITVAEDSGVYRATAADNPDLTATGATEADAIVALANRAAEHGWDAKAEPKAEKKIDEPEKVSEKHETPA